MNEQIKKLSVEAGLDIATNSVGMPIIVTTKDGKLTDPNEAIQRFAELLINDCTGAIEQFAMMQVPPAMITGLVKKKYGVA
jgi:hypothetical protein